MNKILKFWEKALQAAVRVRSARSLAFLAGLLLVCVDAPSFAADKGMLLRAGYVHTISGGVLSPGQVLIRDGKIAEVAEAIEPGEAAIVDLEGLHLYPGLIAPTTSLGLIEVGAVRAMSDEAELGEFTPEVLAWVAVNPDSELLAVARANGITHALVVPRGGRVAGQSGLIALSGWTVRDLTVRAPVALHVFWPSMSLRLSGSTTPSAVSEQIKRREESVFELDSFFKSAAAYAKGRAAQPNADWEPVPAWEAALPYAEKKLPLIVHADDKREIEAAVEWASEQGYSIVVAGGRDAWRVKELLARRGIGVIYNHTFEQPGRDTDPYDINFRAPAILHEAGVKFAFSEGLGTFPASRVRNLPYAAARAVAFGLPAEAALKALTLHPAELLGASGTLGSIEAGKEASLIATDADILDIRANVLRAWIGGVEASLESRHTRLYQRYRARP